MGLGQAYRLVKHGYLTACLGGGVDINLYSRVHAFLDKLDATAQNCNDKPEQALKPFDVTREGLILGDGGAALVIESLESAQRRGAKIYCEIAGYHSNMEGEHILTPTTEGKGIFKSIYYALKEAGIKNNEVDAFNAHAGSTPKGDDAEAQAIKMIAGTDPDKFSKMTVQQILSQKDDELDHKNLKRVAVTAWKSNMGHLSAGAGAAESMFLI